MALRARRGAVLSGVWARWVALLDRREGAETLALVRIVAGIAIAGHLARLAYSGAADLVWVDEAHGGLRPLDAGWLEWFGGATPQTIHAAIAVGIVAALAMASGTYTRLATLVLWLVWRRLEDLNPNAGGSYDELFDNVLFLLLLSGCGRAWSIDARWRGKGGLVTAWPRWLIAFQLVVMYDSTAWQKLSSGWVLGGPGDALWYILQQPTWQRFDMTWIWPAAPILSISSQAIWCFEHASPLLVLAAWYRHTRTRPGWLRAQFNRLDYRGKYLLVGLAMHLGIEATLEVGPFFFATMCTYLAWFAPDEVRRRFAAGRAAEGNARRAMVRF